MSAGDFTLLACVAALGAACGAAITLVWRLGAERRRGMDTDLVRAREQLQGAFGDLARDALSSNSEMFLKLARERLERQQQESAQALAVRETSIAAMLAPIRDSLAKSETQIATLERERVDAFATLRTQLEALSAGQQTLSRETRNLVTALRRPEVRGQWGELTLRRVVELSGMTEHVDYTEQAHLATEAGAVRPDMIVHLPEGRDIVVDVKTPLEAYLAAIDAPDENERRTQLARHAALVGARVRELAAKRYWAQFERSPDFVVLFLPGDQFLGAALQDHPELIDEALRQNVMLATPTSLAALLKAVAYGWKQATLAEHAAEVRRLGEELYKRLATFADHLGKLGKSLGASVESFNRAVGSLEQQVLPAARRFPELGLRVTRPLETLEPVENLARTPREAPHVPNAPPRQDAAHVPEADSPDG